MQALFHTKTGQEIKVGSTVTTFRGETGKLVGFSAPTHSGSTGRVLVKLGRHTSEFFPSVIGAEVRDVK